MRNPVPDPGGSRETILQEAARRRMFRVAGAYLAVSFAGVEGLLTAIHFGHVAGWAFRVALGTALMGFPVAMVLAWDYDITSAGIVRTEEDPPDEPLPEPPILGWSLVVLGNLLLGVVLILLR